MGEVYRAHDQRLKRDVAIKILSAAFAREPDRMRRFELETQTAGRLSHPNILSIFDTGMYEGAPFLVSELLEGETLRDRLRGGRLPLSKAIEYARQAACGLGAAHAQGIVHRDIKPENLFLTKSGHLKILDFGLAKLTASAAAAGRDETRTQVTSPGTILGTVSYMSPEQVRGEGVDHRCDIFSLGCVLYEMLTGIRPFERPSSVETMNAILKEEAGPDLAALPGLPPALDRIVRHCLEKRPDERFQSAQDLVFNLESVSQLSSGSAIAAPVKRRSRRALRAGLAAAFLLLLVGAFFLGRSLARVERPTFQRLTFRRGSIPAARFGQDGHTVIYSAYWEDEPSDLFSVRPESPESRALGFRDYTLLAVSSTGELALLQNARRHGSFVPVGMLARVPFSGGSPRAIQENVGSADWSPDGSQLAVARDVGHGMQLEYPQGTVLYRTAGCIAFARVSPDGKHVAFWDHPSTSEDAGTVAVVDLAGHKRTLTPLYSSAEGLAWGPKGDEIWFTAAAEGARQDLMAVNLSGRIRLIYRQSGSVLVHDVSRDGRVLISNLDWRQRALFRGPGDTRDRDLSWLDWSFATDISADGKTITFSESGEGARGESNLYVRDTSGAPAIKLASGPALSRLSKDGRTVIALDSRRSEIVVSPVGPGENRRLRFPGYTLAEAGILPDGRIWFDGYEPGKGGRLYLVNAGTGAARPVTPENTRTFFPGYTPDGHFLIATSGGKVMLYPVAGGQPEELPGVQQDERLAGWTDDGRFYYVYRSSELPAKIYRAERLTGRREFFREISPADRAGIGAGGIKVTLTPDGRSYVCSVVAELSELHLVEGLK